ncbi:N-6 DNA methylase [Actinomadura rifamycini]|uniref:N-6 DNA methylase n=1 Tax=Actinomadura rifamycini TaxID=31962 RepID=UPI0003F7F26D|nr:N-6 DNA methylase [Actinomadura rifamycini]
MIEAGTLVSMSDIAQRTGVRRPAVSNWRRRHANFPAPVRHSPGELFDAAQVADWLDSRMIPAGNVRPDEPSGTTFGDRFRATFARPGRGGAADGPPAEPQAGPRSPHRSGRPRRHDRAARDERAGREITARLMEWTRPLRTLGDPAAHVDVLLTLLYLRSADPHGWDGLVERWRGHRPVSVNDLEHGLHERLAGDPVLLRMLWEPRRWAESPFIGPRELLALIELLDRETELSDRTVASDVATELLERIAAWEGHRGGEFHTPAPVADLVARLVEPGPGERVHDPCCGTGDLLVAAAALSPPGSAPVLSGSALSPRPLLRAGLNLAFHGLRADLAPDALGRLRSGPDSAAAFDRVVSNPPFAVRDWTASGSSSSGRWPYGVPPERNADFAWLQLVAGSLSPRGRAAVVMAPGTTFRGGREQKIREAMVKDGVVSGVILLPRALFPNTGIAVTVWLLEKGRRPGSDVLLIDAGDVAPVDFGEIVDTYRAWRAGHRTKWSVPARACSVVELHDADYRLHPPALVGARKGGPADREHADHLVNGEAIERIRRRIAHLDSEIFRRLPTAARNAGGHGAPDGVTRPLGELCLIRMGPPRIASGAGDGVPLVTAKQIKDRRIHEKDLQYASHRFVETSPQYRLRSGDIVCVRTGAINRAALVSTAHEGWVLGGGCLLLRPGPDVRPGYLLHYLNHPQAVDWVVRRASGSVMPTISVQQLRRLPVPLPPPERQQEICELLDAIDEKAALHAEIVQRTRELHGRALTALLGDTPAG